MNPSPAAATHLSTGPGLSWDDCRLLLESVADHAILMLDPRGHVVSWSGGSERLTGYRTDEAVGLHVSAFHAPEDVQAGKPERQLEAAKNAGRVEDEGWRLRKDGSRIWTHVVTTALRDETGALRGFAQITRDLTSQRATEAQARHVEERFHALVDAVSDYAIFLLDESGRVSTWNPGASRIKGYEAAEVIGQPYATFYTSEDRAAGKPDRILETVRTQGRYEEEGWRVRKDGSRFWAHVIVTPVRASDGAVTGFAKVTRDLTEQVVWNLLSNAVKFTDAGGTVAIAIAQQRSELVRHIVELHGGRVEAFSAGPDKGATFTITLPVRALAPAAERTEHPSTVAGERSAGDANASLRGVRVLVVDDEDDARELLETVLAEADAIVETAASVAEAFERFVRFRPHVVVSDIGMPDEDGYELMRRVRRLDPSQGGRTPSIALTAYARAEDKAKALGVGFTTHVGKPVNPVDLVLAVRGLAMHATV